MQKMLIALMSVLMPWATYAKTYSVVTFNSEEGIIFVDGIDSTEAFHFFENLQAPIHFNYGTEIKKFVSKDEKFKVTCSAAGKYMCAIIVYPQKEAVLDFDTNEVKLSVSGDKAKDYDAFEKDFISKDGRLKVLKSENGLEISFPGQPL